MTLLPEEIRYLNFLKRPKMYLPTWSSIQHQKDVQEDLVHYSKYNLGSFINVSTSYQQRLDWYLTLSEDMHFEKSYTNMLASIYKAAKEALDRKQPQNSNIWWTEK